jgi:hypothetical protein
MRMLEKDTHWLSRVWTAIAILSVLLLGACAEESGKSESEGNSRDVFAMPDGTVSERAVEPTSSEAEADDKAGCTHMRWCREPGTNLRVCDTNDSTTGACADPATRCFECCSDARAVCGTANPIRFDPPFPGICTCG